MHWGIITIGLMFLPSVGIFILEIVAAMLDNWQSVNLKLIVCSAFNTLIFPFR